MPIRRLVTTVAFICLTLASCTSDEAGSDDAVTDTTPTTGTTTTVAAPILALTDNLELAEGQCWAELPPPSEVLPEPTTTTPGQATQATEPTVPPTLAAPNTTPRPTIVAVVDCGQHNDGTVYANYCLGAHPEFDDDLTAEACPGDSSIEYPGDRTIRRAATRICLQRFTERFLEDYATSERTAEEFVPTEGLWSMGDRRVVCLMSEPES